MSEHWKSTPKYWCKYCSVFVRDTKLERQNHDATGRHQGALKRFLRDLHRGHEREEQDKERARREIDRLNGVVGSSSSGAASSSGSRPQQDPSAKATAAQLAKQREQLAALGVAMPGEVRSEMAIPGEWTVTTTRVIDEADAERKRNDVSAKASGVRKREIPEEEREEAEALAGLFKKQKKWGGTRAMPADDGELDALLSGGILQAPPKKEEEQDEEKPLVKAEEDAGATEAQAESLGVKQEPVDEVSGIDAPEKDAAPTIPDASVKVEEGGVDVPPAVVFKKRKPKNLRQK
jgi:U1 zinc finger protein